MLSNEPMISVIIPVYNADKYLEECLDSVVDQSYKNLEIIIIDDGSTDMSPYICDKYAEKDNRIKVIHKTNDGVADARNRGIETATGEFIAFADSDDRVASDTYARLIEACIKNQTDISCCGYDLFGSKSETWACGKDRVESSKQVLGDMLVGKYNRPVLWNKIFAAHLFEDMRFPKGEVHEDFAVLYRLIGETDRISYVDYNGYHYRKHGSTTLVSGYSTDMMRQQFKDIKLWQSYLAEKYPKLLPVLEDYTAEQYLRMTSLYLQSGHNTDAKEYRWLKKNLVCNIGRILRHRGLHKDKKLKAILICTGLYKHLRDAQINLKGIKH